MQNVFKQFGERAIGSFNSRFKFSLWELTALYAAILIVILFLSSSIIYGAFSNRLEYRFNQATSPSFSNFLPFPPTVQDVQGDLVRSLVWVNIILLVAAGVASYWLARATFKPLQEMHEGQRKFFGDASHELRTPLSILRLDLENQLADKTLSAPIRERIVSNLEEVDRMGKLVNGLLALARFDELYSAKQKNFIPVSLIPLTQHAVERLQVLAKEQQVDLVFNLLTKEKLIILSNEEVLLQTITNIIKNGIMYNRPGGKVIVTIHNDKRHAFITIVDTGVGISKQDLDKIFDRFYRADKSRSSETGGSGLGLAIVRSSMNYLDGTVKIESEVEKGTSIVLEFSLK
ncbi:MAG: histidine kinase [Parcubacteria group bacterium Gr01-1014_13]|nr:MAG: histidine kinase [Parcubacteria group bacterium Gr01-1014_13]